jgi:hypothetical protein
VDAPFALADPRLQARLLAHVDIEEKIPRALQQLGPVAERRVLLLGAEGDGLRARQLEVMGARVTVAEDGAAATAALFDVAVALWPGMPGERNHGGVADPQAIEALVAAERRVVPAGRLLMVEDYGRDEVATLWSDPAREARLTAWSRRDGPLLGVGFRVRVLHCWWTFEDLEQARELLVAAFPDAGAAVAANLKRPRLSYKVAVYHRPVTHAEAAA